MHSPEQMTRLDLKNSRVKTNRLLLSLAVLVALWATGCKSSSSGSADSGSSHLETPDFGDQITASEVVYFNNPPAEGFNAAGSTPIAVVLADQIMQAMGGRKKWDETNVLYWNFFGIRTLLWDKQHNRVRIDIPSRKTVMALNMDDMSGKVWKDGEALTNPDSLSKYLENAKRIWINDSYWLVMPFKLKDSGVTLTYVGEDTTQVGKRADVIRLTFDHVGVTPDNAYNVWVNVDSKLIEQWAYYQDASQDQPNFILPWTDYQEYDGLLLSGERGDRDLTDIKVLKKVPKEAFDSPMPLSL